MYNYKIEFTLLDGSKQVLDIKTDNLPKFVLEWSRGRPVKSHKILESSIAGGKNLLLG